MKLNTKNKLIYIATLLMLIGLLLSIGASYLLVKNRLLTSIIKEQSLKAEVASTRLHGWLDSNLQIVKSLSDSLSERLDELQSSSSLDFYLNQVVRSTDFEYLAYALEQDGYYGVSDWTIPEGYDPRQRPWYKDSKAAMKPNITYYQAVGNEQELMYVAITAPMRVEGRFAGVVSGDISLDFVNETIWDISMDLGGYAMLAQKDGSILVHPEQELIGGNLMEMAMSEGLDIKRTPLTLESPQMQEGERFLYFTSLVPASDWMLVLAINKHNMQARVYRETASLFMRFLAIAAVVMGVFFLVNRKLFSPLIDLLELDHITGLPNKRHFKQRVTSDYLSQSRQGFLLILSINKFSQLTVMRRPEFVKSLINQVRDRLQHELNQRAVLGVFSESRFIVFNPGAYEDYAMHHQWLQSLVDRMAAPYQVGSEKVSCSFSIGVCAYPDYGNDIEELIDNAFSAIADRHNKKSSYFEIYTPSVKRRINKELSVANALKDAIHRGELSVVYQPQLEIESQQFVSMEALVRWHSGELNRSVPPSEFIPLAEEMGLINPIGRFVIEQVAKDISQWRQRGEDYGVIGINLSQKQLAHETFTEDLLRTLDNYHVEPDRIELEITETAVLDNPAEALATLRRLKGCHFHIAIDDFGTGYSSMQYLKIMPIDKIKIDKAFIRELHRDSRDQAIVKAITAMANKLGCRVLAEGVESSRQADFLAANGCSQIQGYLYARPMEKEMLRSFYENFNQIRRVS